MCNCVIPGERRTPIHNPGWGGTHGKERRPGRNAGINTTLPFFLKLSPAPRLQKWAKSGESSTGSAFSDNSSCDSACPGRGSSPVNSQKPSAIQIVRGGNWYNRRLVRSGIHPPPNACCLSPGHERREERDVFPDFTFPIPAGGDARRR